MDWRDIETAKKNRSAIWAVIAIPEETLVAREDLRSWHGVQVPLMHPGLADDGFDVGWAVAAPVGYSGFPDKWIAGWRPMPSVDELLESRPAAGSPIFLETS